MRDRPSSCYNVNKIEIEGVWDKLEGENGLQRQSFKQYLRLNLVFLSNSAIRESFLSLFQDILLILTKL